MNDRFKSGKAEVLFLFLLFRFLYLAESLYPNPGADIEETCGPGNKCKLQFVCETTDGQKNGHCKLLAGTVCINHTESCQKDTVCQEGWCRKKVGLRCVHHSLKSHKPEYFESVQCQKGSICEREYCKLMNMSECGGKLVMECQRSLLCVSMDGKGGDCRCLHKAERGSKKPCNIPKSSHCGNQAQGQCGKGLVCKRSSSNSQSPCLCQTEDAEGKLCPIAALGFCDPSLKNKCDAKTKQVCTATSEKDSLICLGSEGAPCRHSYECSGGLFCKRIPNKEDGLCSGVAGLMQGIAGSFLQLLMTSLIAHYLTLTFL